MLGKAHKMNTELRDWLYNRIPSFVVLEIRKIHVVENCHIQGKKTRQKKISLANSQRTEKGVTERLIGTRLLLLFALSKHVSTHIFYARTVHVAETA